MRFLFLTPGLHPDHHGSIPRYATEAAELLASRGHEVHVLTLDPDSALTDIQLRNGTRIYRIKTHRGAPLSQWGEISRDLRYRVKKLLRETNLETLLATHHAYFERTLRGYRYAVTAHRPWHQEYEITSSGHSNTVFGRIRFRWLSRRLKAIERHSFEGATRIFVPNPSSQEFIRTTHPSLGTRVQVVVPGVNPNRFHDAGDRSGIRTQLGVQSSDFVFMVVSRLESQCGLDELLEAFGSTLRAQTNARLWIAGQGSLGPQLERRIAQLGIGSQTRRLGVLSDAELIEHYSAANAVLIPNKLIPSGSMVAAEALACGTPIIACRTTISGQWLLPEVPECVVDPGPEAFSLRMQQWASGNPPPPVALNPSTKARAIEGWSAVADAFEQAWEDFSTPPNLPVRK
jgi:glycosyltransferase involved in cell wall biosynthesis